MQNRMHAPTLRNWDFTLSGLKVEI